VTGRDASSVEFEPRYVPPPVDRGRLWFFYFPLNERDFDQKILERAGKQGTEMKRIDGVLWVGSLWRAGEK
jgi:hypothetical protein